MDMQDHNSLIKVFENIVVPPLDKFVIGDNFKGKKFKFLDQELFNSKFFNGIIWSSKRGIISIFYLNSDVKIIDLKSMNVSPTLNLWHCFYFIEYLLFNQFVNRGIEGLSVYFFVENTDRMIRLSSFNGKYSLYLSRISNKDEEAFIASKSILLSLTAV